MNRDKVLVPVSAGIAEWIGNDEAISAGIFVAGDYSISVSGIFNHFITGEPGITFRITGARGPSEIVVSTVQQAEMFVEAINEVIKEVKEGEGKILD